MDGLILGIIIGVIVVIIIVIIIIVCKRRNQNIVIRESEAPILDQDEKVEDNMNNKQLFENLLTNILKKSGDKTFKDLLVNYFNNNKFLNLTQEKAGNILFYGKALQ